MREPDDLTAWIDRDCDTWVRVDEVADRGGPWRCLRDGPGWHPGRGRQWQDVAGNGPFTQADRERTAHAVGQIRRLEGVA